MHLTLRVAWHDSQWNGTICQAPSSNSFCLALDRIREERDDVTEDTLASKALADLPADKHPACKAEAGAFMTPRDWVREFKHPYQLLPKTQNTHGHLEPTLVTVPAYSTFAVPFWWMNRENQKEIEKSLTEPLPPDQEPPFPSSWVFGRERQIALTELFFGRLA